jgi:hypothetical protein
LKNNPTFVLILGNQVFPEKTLPFILLNQKPL